MGQQISKEAVISGHAAAILQRQNCRGGMDKPVAATASNQCIQVGRNCPHTNNTTKKDTIPETTAPPSPLPPKGAPAVLAERKSQAVRGIEEFKKQFGIGKGRRQPLTEEEFDRRRQKQKLALQASG